MPLYHQREGPPGPGTKARRSGSGDTINHPVLPDDLAGMVAPGPLVPVVRDAGGGQYVPGTLPRLVVFAMVHRDAAPAVYSGPEAQRLGYGVLIRHHGGKFFVRTRPHYGGA